MVMVVMVKIQSESGFISYKNLSMTFMSLQAFKNADNGRLFGILGLHSY